MVNPDKVSVSESNLVLKENLKKELLEDIGSDEPIISESEEESDDSDDYESDSSDEVTSLPKKANKDKTKKEIIL
jgi:hypothetical protein